MTRWMPGLLTGALLLAPAALAGQDVPLSARSKGAPGAPVTVYEMSDFQCPFCRRHALDVFPQIEREYIRTGKVRWVFVNLPLTSIHPNAVPAAAFAMCAARQDRFWAAHDILFRHQGVWSPLKNPAPFLLTLVDSLRLQRAPMEACLQRPETVDQIKADADGAVKSGAQSTPTFYIEGGMMAGTRPIEVFRMVLDSVYAVKTRGRR
jgi:protein-disulfide isomerase